MTVPIGDFQHKTLDLPFSSNANTNIDATTLYETITDQLWCISLACTTTPNKVLLVTTKGQLPMAHDWVNKTVPALYAQHIANKIDVTTLKPMTPF